MGVNIDYSRRVVSFYEKNGLKFFNKFNALNSRMKSVDLKIEPPENVTAIMARDEDGKKLGVFEMVIRKDISTIEGKQLISFNEREGNGQLLALSGLMEFAENRVNHFTYFSGPQNIPFLARLGFVIDNDDTRYLMNGLKQIMKSKMPSIEGFKYKAQFFHSRLKMLGDVVPDDKSIFQNSGKVLSDFIKLIARYHYPKKYYPYLEVGSDMRFTDWDLLVNKPYLNKLMEKHYLDYKF